MYHPAPMRQTIFYFKIHGRLCKYAVRRHRGVNYSDPERQAGLAQNALDAVRSDLARGCQMAPTGRKMRASV